MLSDLGHGAVAEGLRLLRVWPEAVGPEIAAHAEPAGLRDGVLEVRTDSSAWANELRMRQPEILEGLRQQLGDEAPRRIRLRVG